MSYSLVARRYATALLELGAESGQLDALVRELGFVADTYSNNEELRKALENPLVAHQAKKALVVEVAERLGAGSVTKSTLQLLVDRRRMRVLPSIARSLRELSDARKGLLRAEVTSAAPLPDAYYQRLQQTLEKMTGKKVAIEKRQDPALIAGVITRIGDRVFDGSLQSRLAAMRDALLPN